MCGVVADGWVTSLPMAPLPDRWPASRADGFAAVLELPLGDVFDDIAAMYRTTDHRHPVLNGASGFEATHYFTLKSALEEHDPAALDGLPADAPVLVVVDQRKDPSRQWLRFLESGSRITPLGSDRHWQFFSAGSAPPRAPVCGGDPVAIASAVDRDGPAPLRVLTDRDPRTWWTTVHAQQVGDTLDAGARTPGAPVCGRRVGRRIPEKLSEEVDRRDVRDRRRLDHRRHRAHRRTDDARCAPRSEDGTD